MSQQLSLHRAVKVVQKRHEFPPGDECDGFFKLDFVVTDDKGNETSIAIFSDEELHVEEGS